MKICISHRKLAISKNHRLVWFVVLSLKVYKKYYKTMRQVIKPLIKFAILIICYYGHFTNLGLNPNNGQI